MAAVTDRLAVESRSMVRASRAILALSPAVGGLVAALVYTVGVLSSNPDSVWGPLFLAYFTFIGLAVGAITGFLMWLAVRARPRSIEAVVPMLSLGCSVSLIAWLFAYPVVLLTQSEYTPVALTVLPAILCGVILTGALTAILRGSQRHSSSISHAEPIDGNDRVVFGRSKIASGGVLLLAALLPLGLLYFAVGYLIPVRLSGRSLWDAIPTLASEPTTDLGFRVAFLCLWVVLSVGLGIWRLTATSRVRSSEVVAIALLIEGSILSHTWWLAAAVSSELFWRDPNFGTSPDPNPYSELLWVLEICAWVSILVACAIFMRRWLSSAKPR